jgi:hypothetical protein
MQDDLYRYMIISTGRKMFDYKTGLIVEGKVLGFQALDRIYPTVGVYGDGNPVVKPSPTEVKLKLDEIPVLVGASLYLGDTSDSSHVEAIWESLQ